MTRDLHLLPFDGKIDFNKVAKDIGQSKYNGPVMLEVYHSNWFGGDELYKDMKPSAYLRKARESGEKLTQLVLSSRKSTSSRNPLVSVD
jgi:sugar phosphate isomerase/epimerase